MTKAVYGIVRTHAEAASLIEKLRNGGFSSTEVSILAPHNQHDEGLVIEKHTKSLEGTATGATAGGVLGAVLGLLAGIGTLAFPGLGHFSRCRAAPSHSKRDGGRCKRRRPCRRIDRHRNSGI